MAWTTPLTWTVGQVVTAAQLNQQIRDNENFLFAVPNFVGTTAGGAISLTNATNTAIAFDTNQVDNYSGHNTVTNNTRYTAQLAGRYLLFGRVGFVFNATGSRAVAFRINGGSVDLTTNTNTQPPTVTDGAGVMTSAMMFLNLNDYVEVMAFQRSGGALNTVSANNRFEALWIGAA